MATSFFRFVTIHPFDRPRKRGNNANVLSLTNLRLPDATPVLLRFNYDAMPNLKSLNLDCHIIAFLLLIHYFTLWP